MLECRKIDDYQATYLEDEKIGNLIDCPVCGGQNTLEQEGMPVWSLTQVVLRSFGCNQCDRLIFVVHKELVEG